MSESEASSFTEQAEEHRCPGEEHQTNLYPAEAGKKCLAYYSGINLTQLYIWFANARHRTEKFGTESLARWKKHIHCGLLPIYSQFLHYNPPPATHRGYIYQQSLGLGMCSTQQERSSAYQQFSRLGMYNASILGMANRQSLGLRLPSRNPEVPSMPLQPGAPANDTTD